MIAELKERIRAMLPRNSFARSVSVLAGGTAAGQIIVVAASPVLTRLYSPEDFGLLAVFAGLLGILGVVASLRYQLAIPLPEREEEAAYVTVLSLLVVLAMTSLTAVVVVFFGSSITTKLNTPALEPYLWLLPVGLMLIGIYQVFNYWAIRVQAFAVIARTKLVQAVGMISIQLGGHAFGPVALLLGQASGHGAGASTLGLLAIRRKWDLFSAVRAKNISWAVHRYRRFPIYSSWSGLINAAGTQLPPILFAALFSPAAAGIYLLAHRVLAMPMQFMGMSIANVFYSRVSEALRDGTLAPMVAKVHQALSHIAMPPTLILLLAGPEMFGFVFGSQWSQAGQFAQWMAPFIYIQFATSPLSTLHSALEKQAQGTAFHAILFCVRMIALAYGALLNDLMLTVALFSLGSAACWVGFLLWLLKLSGNKACRTAAKSAGKATLVGLALASPLFLVTMTSMSDGLFIAGLAFTIVLIIARYIFLARALYE